MKDSKLFEKGFIKDEDCSIHTPVVYGYPEKPIYGKGVRIKPIIPGKQETEYDKKIYLKELLPLEEYTKIIVLLSGGKDSIACYWKLRELGVPAKKIELWHHDIDGKHPKRRMDWPVTKSYVKAFAKFTGSRLVTSWREDGFFGELYRIGASQPVHYECNGKCFTCPLTAKQKKSEELRNRVLEDESVKEMLKELGYRFKFPAKSGDLSKRWCSAYLKIDIASSVLRDISKLSDLENQKILVVSGERRGESNGRAKYNEMEVHRTNAVARAHRTVHQWRAVIQYSERDVWEVMRRHGIKPHPCYIAGWNRCSCSQCIFSLPKHFAGIRELFPEEYEALKEDEIRLGFTIDNKKCLDDYVGDAKSCVCWDDPEAIWQLVIGEYSDIYIDPDKWTYPAGAFKGSEGGPC